MPTDAQLLARISSDATGEALRALYRAYAGELYGFALNALATGGPPRRSCRRSSPAPGGTARPMTRHAGERLRTWLYQIARHAIVDTRRRAAVRPALALREPRDEQDPEGLSIERAMLGWQVAAALEKLTPEHRQVIRLAHVRRAVRARDRGAARAPQGNGKEPHVVRPAFAAAGLGGDGGPGMTPRPRGHRRLRLGRPRRRRRAPGARAPRDLPGVRDRARRGRGHPRAARPGGRDRGDGGGAAPPGGSRSACWTASRASGPSGPAKRGWRPRLAWAGGSALAALRRGGGTPLRP